MLWLSRCIFCCRSLKVAKRYNLANQIHEGKFVCLSQLILGYLYESLGLVTKSLRNIQPKDGLLLFVPFWLLQLWLNTTFELSLHIKPPNEADESIKEHCIEGTCLNLLTLADKNRSDREAFVSYFLMLTRRYHFNATMDPCYKRTCRPEWFTREFPPTGEHESKSKKYGRLSWLLDFFLLD